MLIRWNTVLRLTACIVLFKKKDINLKFNFVSYLHKIWWKVLNSRN